MTKLDSINIMLSGIGETALDCLEEPYSSDVAQALMVLNQTVEEIQLIGWYFNTEENIILLPDSGGFVLVPADIHRLTIAEGGGRYIKNGSRIYDTVDRTYNIGRRLIADITRTLSFEMIPLSFQHYVSVRAARKYQNNILGSSNIRNFQERDEMEARLICLKEEQNIRRPSIQVGGASMLNGWSVKKSLRR